MDIYQSKALESWYKEDNPLRLELRHPLIKLVGEAGELLDLYGKQEYKSGFSWRDCKECGQSSDDIFHGEEKNSHVYIPKVLDELGDWWYYIRIITWQKGISIKDWVDEENCVTRYNFAALETIAQLNKMNRFCSKVLDRYVATGKITKFQLKNLHFAFSYFYDLLIKLDYSIDQLTELNYKKLNSEPTQHGWNSAR
jgi:hypothetical protein